MNKLLQVARHEYTRNVLKKSFIFTLLSVPLMILLNVGIGVYMESVLNSDAAVGYIDPGGVLANPLAPPLRAGQEPIELIQLKDEGEAQAALEAKSIQAYYVIHADYPVTRRVDLFFFREPGSQAEQQFNDFLQVNLLSTLPPEVAYRAASGAHVTVRSLDGSREMARSGPGWQAFLPLITGFAFIFLLVISSGYLMSAVVEEKENRTIEILVTSYAPERLIAGKVVGIVGISLTILLVWCGVAIAGLTVARQAGVGWMQGFQVDWGALSAIIAIAIPAYILAAALMTALGATVASPQEGQSLGGIFFMLHFLPIYMTGFLIENPEAPVSIVMSLLPFTALMTLSMRNMFGMVPGWQILLSVVVQSLCALGALWLAGRAFRLGMLRYGQRLNLVKILRG